MELKPLGTAAEIYAAYPEHKKYHENALNIEAAKRLLEHMRTNGTIFADLVTFESDDLEFKILANEYERLVGGAGILQQSELRMEVWGEPNTALLKVVFAAFGIDYDKFMAEKQDMIDQVRARQA